MDYLMQLARLTPRCLAAAAVLYAAVYIIEKKKRGKISFGRTAAEFLLLWWFVTFVYITQIYRFGNGLGDLYNIRPLRVFVVAFRYGMVRAEIVKQFALNIVMFLPLGLLLPVVFPKKCRSWWRIFLISLTLTVITEFLQLFSRRGTDIDDVIANTLGGMCGYALFLICYGIAVSAGKAKPMKHYGGKLAFGIVMLALALAPYAALAFAR